MKIKLKKLLTHHKWNEAITLLSKKDIRRLPDSELSILALCLMKTSGYKEVINKTIGIVEPNVKQYPRTTRIAARAYCMLGEYDKAQTLVQKAFDASPTQYWYYLSLGDIHYYFSGNLEKALELYKQGEKIGSEHLKPHILSIYRYLLKRISHILYDLKRFEDAIPYFEKFKQLEPSNFYESDFVLYGLCHEKCGNTQKAKEIWREGTVRRKGNKCKKEIERVDPELAKTIELRPLPNSRPGATKIPIKTKIITEENEASDVIAKSIEGKAEPGDVVTFASAVAAVSEGRIFSAECIKPSGIAKFLSGFVTASSKNSFATTSPLANPLSFQVAIEIAGLTRILIATIIGAIGKLFRIKGWFYHIAGADVAMIDDMPASMAPYDFFVIPGPYDSDVLAELIKEKTGLEAAIIDANDLGIAWVTGASSGVDRKKVKEFMLDNPAGNEDDQTPVILIRETR
ncbi:MAG TPA: coenzyme F420-0:L-glutamate ligase [Caldisericia bacterium]|nr:coenzyme F420-0:L-glutamate ligase [Caldisericia bacterium]HPF49022.1 coenzyme F420-0:L-glutamate ligase [Caldisericia bacterium]HPI83114.1 coenzyme F420-0:L-glutamate ligase [Caldisericia bacterium]HPQ92341.1 coenzyme F420-0:L-glutamate ligase [Caldisericia bacterium]HRV74561.1 coenzyme F420-0:L-glutamate ligase [Caldisericia bacterium]